jgi:methionyl-tRNA synthetase
MRMVKILITAALPYVNNIPHLGNVVPIVSADVFARFHRLLNNEVCFVCGTDDHGTTAEVQAIKEKTTPKKLTDKYSAMHKELYDWFNCKFDCYGRSSGDSNQKITQDVFRKLYKNGFITQHTITQMFDPEVKRFLADRFIEGTCPHCGYEDARGDQCDKCSKLLDPSDLIKPRSKVSKATPIEKETTHLFVDLANLQKNKNLPKDLETWVAENKDKWSLNASSTTEAWLKEGLRKRCITRDLEWGIPVPKMEGLTGFDKKVFYSWFDAPIAYIGITSDVLGKLWESWWKNPKDVTLVQFMGKDNFPFHTLLFPALLLGTKESWTLMNEISGNEYINYEGGKFSKSRNVGVFCDQARNSGIPADVYRYYLSAIRPEREDTDFSWKDFQVKINKELIGNIGNFINRTLTFISKFNEGKITDSNSFDIYDDEEVTPSSIKDLLEEHKQKAALQGILKISQRGNEIFQHKEPWKKIKEDPQLCSIDLSLLARRVKDLAILVQPFMPNISAKIFTQLNLDQKEWLAWDKLGVVLPDEHVIGEPTTLFVKLEDIEVEGFQEQFGGEKKPAKKKSEKKKMTETQPIPDKVFPLDLRVGKIMSIEAHSDADKLFISQINLGNNETRQIVSGLKDFYNKEDLLGQKVIVVCNLQEATIRGEKSQGMVLAGEDTIDEKTLVKVLTASHSESGSKVTCGMDSYDKEISFKQFLTVKMKIDKNTIFYNEQKLVTEFETVNVDLEKGIIK